MQLRRTSPRVISEFFQRSPSKGEAENTTYTFSDICLRSRHEPLKELKVQRDHNQDRPGRPVDPCDPHEGTALLCPDQHQPVFADPISRRVISKDRRIKTTNKEIAMFSERALMALMGSGLVTTLMTALMLADGSSWPRALVVGLGAGGAVLLGIVTLLNRGGEQ